MPQRTQFPIGAAITLTDLEDDAHLILHKLRISEPISWLPVLDAWLVTRYDDAVRVMRDAKSYTVDHPGFSTAQVVGPSMLSLDGEKQFHHRMPFERPFRRKEVEARFNEAVIEHITQLIDGFVANGRAELRRDFAGPVAVKTMITALGLEDTAVSAVLNWYDTIVDAVTRVTAGESVSKEGRAAFAALRENLLPSLRQQSDSSLLAAAGGMADGLTDDQIISNAAVLLFGGIETTEGMIANALYHLLDNPALMHALVADGLKPAQMANVIEESLRLEPAASVIDRYTTRDIQLDSAFIEAGALVRISLAGANRDPEIFHNPDQFDPSRTNLRSHVAFAQGPHVCLGLHLARLEAQHALVEILRRLPNLRLEDTYSAIQAVKPRGLVFRKPQALYTVWDA